MQQAASVGPVLPRRSAPQADPELDDEVLAAVVSDVWQQQLGRTLRRPSSAARPPVADFTVSAFATIEANAPLVISLRAPAGVAAAMASSRLDLHESELATGDIDDAVTGLLGDVVARLARLVPGVAGIGPTSVVQGSGLSLTVGGAELDCEVTMLAGASPLRVSVWRPRAAPPS